MADQGSAGICDGTPRLVAFADPRPLPTALTVGFLGIHFGRIFWPFVRRKIRMATAAFAGGANLLRYRETLKIVSLDAAGLLTHSQFLQTSVVAVATIRVANRDIRGAEGRGLTDQVWRGLIPKAPLADSWGIPESRRG
jgi:hypothetical protein